ncbi:MAG: hypothetical protein IE890_02845 [Arcobacter sp.]|nr:hypothetical protein [Arcobacter sp.]
MKPKFDRFLIEKVQCLPCKKNANGELSLDYKVKIVAIDNKVETIEKKNPLFFGNMGDGPKKKFIHASELKVEFLSFVPEVKKAIEEHFESFLALTNFGTRQSKGYGSFYLDKPFDATLIPYKVYSFNTTNWKKDIKLLYSFLRQGINRPKGIGSPLGFYSKPAIFTYAVKNKWTWDKKAIKQHFFPDNSQGQNYSGEETYLLRDLFGLSSEQTWMSYKANIKKEDNEKKIDRFKSPITFKKVSGKVYFWADKSVEIILNKSFKVSTGGKKLDLSTPKEFSFDAFFEYVKTINLSQHIDSKYHKESEFNTLKRILNDIKASK